MGRTFLLEILVGQDVGQVRILADGLSEQADGLLSVKVEYQFRVRRHRGRHFKTSVEENK